MKSLIVGFYYMTNKSVKFFSYFKLFGIVKGHDSFTSKEWERKFNVMLQVNLDFM
jgi:hypothetical protein